MSAAHRFTGPLCQSRAVAFAVVVSIVVLLSLGVAGAGPKQALAAAAGPFEVEGPASSYAWNGSQLAVTGEGVVIAGMVEAGTSGDVAVATGVERVGIGDGVHIDTLSVARTVRLDVSGRGNAVDVSESGRDIAVGGSGFLALRMTNRLVDVYGSVTVRLAGSVAGMQVWERATLVVLPGATIAGSLTVLGGVLDLTQVHPGEPVSVSGVSVGNPGQTLAVAAPFGATHLNQLLEYSFLSVNDATPVYEDGEEIGTLQKDGSFLITATRTVTFEGFDGVVLSTERVPLFSAASAPEPIVPKGYRFVGWDAPFDYVTKDMTVTALFDMIPEPASPGTAASSDGTPSLGSSDALPQSRRSSAANMLAATGDDGAALAVVAGVAAGVALLVAMGALIFRRARERTSRSVSVW